MTRPAIRAPRRTIAYRILESYAETIPTNQSVPASRRRGMSPTSGIGTIGSAERGLFNMEDFPDTQIGFQQPSQAGSPLKVTPLMEITISFWPRRAEGRLRETRRAASTLNF